MNRTIEFAKYQGNGNDFVIINNLQTGVECSLKSMNGEKSTLEKLCDRRLGVGADGVLMLNRVQGRKSDVTQDNNNETGLDILYCNRDGIETSLCGNGTRCAVKEAYQTQPELFRQTTNGSMCRFKASDGIHVAYVTGRDTVRLKMSDVHDVRAVTGHDITSPAYYIDTGSPHHVQHVDDLANCDVTTFGRNVRQHDIYQRSNPFTKYDGTNVNFVQEIDPDTIMCRTFERGVEAETPACGTGAVAAAIATHRKAPKAVEHIVKVKQPGGDLVVTFTPNIADDGFSNVWLEGPATKVYTGIIEL